MYYPNRQALGEQLATKLSDFANNETIIFCLKKSSLLACVALAAKLHAYIYILQYSEVDDPYDVTRSLGAVTSVGEFVLNPDISQFEYEYIFGEFKGIVEQRKQAAFMEVNTEDLNPHFNLAVFNNRNIVMFADILDNVFQVQIAFDVLKNFVPRSIIGAFGNITTEVSDKFRRDADGCTYMDALASNLFDDEHYFDQPDAYTEAQEIQMANNISLYWA